MEMVNKYKLAVLETHPVQYRVPIYEKLSKHPKVDLTVYFCSKHNVFRNYNPSLNNKIEPIIKRHLEKFNHIFLKNHYPTEKDIHPKYLFNLGIIRELISNKYDAILVYGYMSWTSKIAMVLGKITRTPIVFTEVVDLKDYSSKFSKKVKSIILPLIFKIPSAFTYSYTRNRKFYRHYRVPEEKLFFAPCAVDNEFFQGKSKEFSTKTNQLKKKYGIQKDKMVFLFTGKLENRKRVWDILKSYERLGNEEREKSVLVFAGVGPEEEKMKEYVKTKNLESVKFLGFINNEKTPEVYSIADAFLIVSDYDPAPKVMNEAMNFSLPIITSNTVGTSEDLVKQNRNGYIIETGDIKKLSEHMERLINNKKLREKMGKKSLKIVSKWNFDEDVKAIVRSLDYIYEKTNSKPKS